MKLETNRSTVSSSSAYSHETANIVSVINGNVLNLLITLKEIEKSFSEEFTRHTPYAVRCSIEYCYGKN